VCDDINILNPITTCWQGQECLLWLIHSRDDSVTNAIPGSSPRDGTLYSKLAADSLNKFHSLCEILKMTTGNHFQWNGAYDIANQFVQYPTINGYNVDFGSPNIFDWFLQFTTANDRKPRGY
jgi:hypothetical protein